MSKLVIIGAAGMVGREILNYSVLDRIHNEIVAVDKNKDKMSAEIQDLLDASPACFDSPDATLINGDYADTQNADIIVVSASIPMSKDIKDRNDLLEKNTLLMKDIATSIMPYNTNALFIIVSNPAEAMAHAFLQSCNGKVKAKQVISSGTLLETSRLKHLLSEHYNVSLNSIFMPIYGEHGANILIPWSLASVQGVKLHQLEKGENINAIDKSYVDKYIKERAFTILKHRGYTDHAIARTVCRIISSALTNKKTLLSAVGACIEDFYSLKNIFINLPVLFSEKGVDKVFIPDLTSEEFEELYKIAKNMYKNQQIVDEILKKHKNVKK